jgi:hypothetical protein
MREYGRMSDPWQRIESAITGVVWVLAAAVLTACAPKPLVEYTTDVPPLILTTTGQAGIEDERARFREIFCAVDADHGAELPDYRPCEEALVRLAGEPPPTGRPVYLGPARSKLHLVGVPGYSWSCIEDWANIEDEIDPHIASLGFGITHIRVSGFSSTEHNAREIRDQLVADPDLPDGRSLVFVGHSKGVVDILEAVVSYPEVEERTAAVVSVAGAVGGSVLADAPPKLLVNMLKGVVSNEKCERGDGLALESLRPALRRAWLSENELPEGVRYFSLVALPDRQHVSTLLLPSYDVLSQVDPRNDGQLLFYDQVIPRGALMGYLKADHWAVAVALGRSRSWVMSIFTEKNAYPREVLIEAIVRHVEEQILLSK